MAITTNELRVALVARIEFGPQTRRPIDERLRERLPESEQSDRSAALEAAREVVRIAERLVREFRAGERTEETIQPALLKLFPWLDADAAPVQSSFALPGQDLSLKVRSFAYHLVMM